MAIIQAQGQGLNPLIQALITKQQLELQKEDQKLRQADFKLRQKEAAERRQQEQYVILGAQLGAQLFGADPMKAQKGLGMADPAILPSAIQTLQGFQQTAGQMGLTAANTRIAEAGAAVGEATVQPRIREVKAGATKAESEARVATATEGTRIAQARASLADTNIRNSINSEILHGSDPVNGARALSQWVSTGLPWGQVKEAVGFTGEASISDDAVFTPAESGAGGQERSRAQSFLPGMSEAHARIQQLGVGDFDGDGFAEMSPVRMTVLSSLQQAAGSGVFDVIANKLQDPQQRALVQANRNFADLYRFSLSGQQSSDQERLNMMLSITETAGDDPAVIAQKARMRALMIQVTRQRASGMLTAQEAASQMLTASLALGDASITASYANLLNNVIEESGGVSISGVPGDNTLNDVAGIVDSTLDGR